MNSTIVCDEGKGFQSLSNDVVDLFVHSYGLFGGQNDVFNRFLVERCWSADADLRSTQLLKVKVEILMKFKLTFNSTGKSFDVYNVSNLCKVYEVRNDVLNEAVNDVNSDAYPGSASGPVSVKEIVNITDDVDYVDNDDDGNYANDANVVELNLEEAPFDVSLYLTNHGLCLTVKLIRRYYNEVYNSRLKVPAQDSQNRAVDLLRCGDVEANPGPNPGPGTTSTVATSEAPIKCQLQVISQNVRGLGEPKKVRHLVNNCYKLSKRAHDCIFLFQETYVTNLNLLNFLWRGEYHLTMGTGNSLGCITLLTAPYKINIDRVTSPMLNIVIPKS